MPLVLDVIYLVVLAVLSPWLLYRRVIQRKPIAGFGRKLRGEITRQHPERPCVWFHAVSVGEVLQLQTLIADFQRRHPDKEVVLTTSTGTGYDVACQKFPTVAVNYWPFDFSHAVRHALRSARPELVALVELELWPNFLREARRQGIPIALINGRITERSFRGYQRLNRWLRPLWSNLAIVTAQTEEYADRFRALGVPNSRLHITGNIKFDRVEMSRENVRTLELRRCLGLRDDELVWIAGSTQDPEEALALDAYRTLRRTHPQLRLIVVPRHKERFEEVARQILAAGFPLVRRTAVTGAPQSRAPENAESPVLLLDTLGELGACWGLADVAFVGGSLTQRGGQNMLEPAAYGAAVIFGPNTWNFKDIVRELLTRNAACVVAEAAALTPTVQRLLADANERKRLGDAAQTFVRSQQGATQLTLDLLETSLPDPMRIPQAA